MSKTAPGVDGQTVEEDGQEEFKAWVEDAPGTAGDIRHPVRRVHIRPIGVPCVARPGASTASPSIYDALLVRRAAWCPSRPRHDGSDSGASLRRI